MVPDKQVYVLGWSMMLIKESVDRMPNWDTKEHEISTFVWL